MVFVKQALKFTYQPSYLKVKQFPISAAHYFPIITELFTAVLSQTPQSTSVRVTEAT
jgi:hypothetical protein